MTVSKTLLWGTPVVVVVVVGLVMGVRYASAQEGRVPFTVEKRIIGQTPDGTITTDRQVTIAVRSDGSHVDFRQSENGTPLRANIAGTLSVVAIREQGEKETQHVRQEDRCLIYCDVACCPTQ